jgi:hypothetical protein
VRIRGTEWEATWREIQSAAVQEVFLWPGADPRVFHAVGVTGPAERLYVTSLCGGSRRRLQAEMPIGFLMPDLDVLTCRRCRRLLSTRLGRCRLDRLTRWIQDTALPNEGDAL